MRAPANAPTGNAGQSYVKAKFEELGWGANNNFEHDLGTDLWLMARDDRRFELRELVGAQVKTGPTYFDSPERDQSGVVQGWWYAESNDRHFDYWCEHSVPHLLVLHDLDAQTSYWVHVTRDKVRSTGKGRKILVPASSTVDWDHFDDLIEVATSRHPAPLWEGSAWDGVSEVEAAARLRYALVTPRLVAPHPNRRAGELDAHQAIALLVQMRVRDLNRPGDAAPGVDVEVARTSDLWEWRLFAGLHDWVMAGTRTKLAEVLAEADSAHRRAAASVCVAAACLENGEPEQACLTLRAELESDESSPTDQAWLLAQLSRCLMEQGDLTGAREAALEVQTMRHLRSTDPTASAFTAAAANTVFNLGGWDEPSLAEVIRISDTAQSWWRAQTLAAGLARHFDDSFRWWVGDSTTTFGVQDESWTKLRSVMLTAGYAADWSAWSDAGSRLARHQLMTTPGEESIVAAIDLLRLTGDKKWLKATVARTLQVGPVQALVHLGSQLDLTKSTRTSLSADLAFVEGAADVLADDDCDRFISWALGVLRDGTELTERLSPTFLVASSVLDMLQSLVHAASPEKRREVIEHLICLPAVTDQLAAKGYGRVLAQIPDDEWSDEQLEALRQRPGDDNWELTDDVDSLLARRDPEFRQSLHIRVEAGDMRALQSHGNVTDLPTKAAAGMIAHLTGTVQARVEDAKRGAFALGGFDALDALVLLDICHPSVADWSAVEAILALPVAHPDHISGGIRRLGALADRVPADVRERLRPHLEEISRRVPPQIPSLFGPRNDARSESQIALSTLYPSEVLDADIRRLLGGERSLRRAAAEILIARRDESQLNALGLLAHDNDVDVRAAAAEGLAWWVVEGVGLPGSLEVLEGLLGEGGVRLAVRVSSALLDDGADPAAARLLGDRLDAHPSATVRARVARATRLSTVGEDPGRS